MLKRTVLVLATVLVSAAAIVPIGLAGKPTIVRESFDVTFPDAFLSDVCGTEVETRAVGHQMARTSTSDNGHLLETFTVNALLTATSADGTYRFRDVGADITRITKDGIVQQIIGQLPFWFNGIAWVNPITGEVLKSPTGADLFEPMIEEACAALAP